MNTKRIDRILGALWLFACTGVAAQTATATAPATGAGVPSFAIYSQLAREVSVTHFQESTGTRISNNLRQRITVPDGALDTAAVVIAGQAVRKALPTARTWLVAPTDEDLFDSLQATEPGRRVAFPDDMAKALREQGSTQLLLFTRYRADASLRALYTREGTGQIDGLGFYVDHQTPMKRSDTNETGRGFLAPYAQFRSSLVDVASQRVLRTRTSSVSDVYSAARAQGDSTHPWDVMTSAQKMTVLRDMLKAEVERVVPELLAQP